MTSYVSVIKNEDVYNATFSAVEKLNVDLNGKVLIKPNLTLDVSIQRHACTSPEVVKALIDIIRNHGGEPFVGESSMVGCDTLKVYEKSGLKKVCEDRNVKFIDFNRCKPINIPVDGDFINEIVVAEDLKKFDKIISAPVMKTHIITGVTLGMKNMKGIQYKNEKIKLHEKGMKMLHVGIVDINTVFPPYLTVIDASYAQEGEGPVGGNVIKMDLVIASKDVVSADATACRIMGIDPYEVAHIKMAWERGIGEIEDIKIYGENIDKIRRKFRYPFSNLKRIKYKLFDFGMDFTAKLKGTTEEERAYKTVMKLMKTQPYITSKCKKCKKCINVCPYNAISSEIKIDYRKCRACMICMEACLFHAIKSKEISTLKATKEISICMLRVAGKAISGRLYR